MIHARICDLLGIAHPVVLGGIGTATSAPLVAAVSNAGGLGTLGASGMTAAQVKSKAHAIRAATEKPFGINHLLFRVDEEAFAVTIDLCPPVIAFAWAHSNQDLHAYFQRARDAGSKVMHMAGEVSLAVKGAEAEEIIKDRLNGMMC